MGTLNLDNQANDPMREIADYGKQIDPLKPVTEGIVNGYIAWRLAIYKKKQYRDSDLWEVFVEGFDGFQKTTFDTANKDYVRDLQDYLRANCVFVYKQARSSIANELCKVLAEKEPYEWTRDEINEQIKSHQGLNSAHGVNTQQPLPTPFRAPSQDAKLTANPYLPQAQTAQQTANPYLPQVQAAQQAANLYTGHTRSGLSKAGT
jgi:hypothetical protein